MEADGCCSQVDARTKQKLLEIICFKVVNRYEFPTTILKPGSPVPKEGPSMIFGKLCLIFLDSGCLL